MRGDNGMAETRATMSSVTPMIPTGPSLSAALSYFTKELGFSVQYEVPNGAGIERDGIAFNLVQNDNRVWADNSSFSIGVSDLDALHKEYAGASGKVGPLEMKPWGRREFHMILPSGVCFQFYER
jgi:hypothetical protein